MVSYRQQLLEHRTRVVEASSHRICQSNSGRIDQMNFRHCVLLFRLVPKITQLSWRGRSTSLQKSQMSLKNFADKWPISWNDCPVIADYRNSHRPPYPGLESPRRPTGVCRSPVASWTKVSADNADPGWLLIAAQQGERAQQGHQQRNEVGPFITQRSRGAPVRSPRSPRPPLIQ